MSFLVRMIICMTATLIVVILTPQRFLNGTPIHYALFFVFTGICFLAYSP